MTSAAIEKEFLTNPLKALLGYGQSVWLDFIRRSLITSGELGRLVEEDGLCGMTSNPSIFEKAIVGSTSEYEQQGSLSAETPLFEAGGIRLFTDPKNADTLKKADRGRRALRAHLGSNVGAGLAILAAAVKQALQ